MPNYRKDGFIIDRVDGEVVTNFPQVVIHHSPTGMEFGYGGSGPADMALNILELTLRAINYHGDTTPTWDRKGCFELAMQKHQDFKWAWIAPMSRDVGAVIPFATVLAFLGIQKVED